MSLMEITITGDYFEQSFVSRFNYVSQGTPAAVSESFALASAWVGGNFTTPGATSPMGRMLSVMSNLVNVRELFVRNVYSETDFYATPLSLLGAGVGADAAPFLALGFTSNRIKLTVRRGQKRLPGMLEEWMDQGGVLTSAILDEAEATAAAWSEVLEYDDEGNILSFTPTVCSKEKYAVPDTDPVRFAYRYYEDEAVQLTNSAIGVVWSVRDRVRSQMSRQYGRGN